MTPEQQQQGAAAYAAYTQALTRPAYCRAPTGCGPPAPRPRSAPPTARRRSSTGRSSTPRNSSAATTSSTCPTWTRRSPGLASAPVSATVWSKSAPSGPWTRSQKYAGGQSWPRPGDHDSHQPVRGALVHETAEAVARHSYGKLVACLAARSGNVAAAEDALSEAFAAALGDGRSRAAHQIPKPGC